MKNFIIALSLISANLLFAENVSFFNGHSTIKVNPEFATVWINFHAECFEDKTAMNEQLAQETNKIHTQLMDLLGKDGTVDNHPSAARKYERRTGYGEEMIVTCRNTWAREHSIEVTISNMERFYDIYSSIQDMEHQHGDTNTESEVIYSSVGEPSGWICDELRSNTFKKAHTQAVENATEIFRASVAGTYQGSLNYNVVFNPEVREARSSNFEISDSANAMMSASRTTKSHFRASLSPIEISAFVRCAFVHENITCTVNP